MATFFFFSKGISGATADRKKVNAASSQPVCTRCSSTKICIMGGSIWAISEYSPETLPRKAPFSDRIYPSMSKTNLEKPKLAFPDSPGDFIPNPAKRYSEDLSSGYVLSPVERQLTMGPIIMGCTDILTILREEDSLFVEVDSTSDHISSRVCRTKGSSFSTSQIQIAIVTMIPNRASFPTDQFLQQGRFRYQTYREEAVTALIQHFDFKIKDPALWGYLAF